MWSGRAPRPRSGAGGPRLEPSAAHLYRRGPEKTRTYVYAELVFCPLRGGFTRVEQTLLEEGHGDDVIRQRIVFQQVMRRRSDAVVDEATAGKVIGFMSGNQQDRTRSPPVMPGVRREGPR